MSKEPRPDELQAAIHRQEQRAQVEKINRSAWDIVRLLSETLELCETGQMPHDVAAAVQEALRHAVFVHFWTERKLTGRS